MDWSKIMKFANQNDPLTICSGNGDLVQVKRLLDLGIKPSNEAIIDASKNGHSKVVELLIKGYGNIYDGIKEGFNIACEDNDKDTIQVLCKRLRISVINKEFINAHECGSYGVMRILLDFLIRRYNLEYILAKIDNNALLDCSVETCNIELVKLLLEKNNNVNSYPCGNYMYGLATSDGNNYSLDIIKLLLKNNFTEGDELYDECNCKDSRIELVKLLLEYLKPSVTHINKCIIAARKNGRRDVEELIYCTFVDPCIICQCYKGTESKSCPIRLHCKHFYHPSCIKEWVNVSKKVNCCACTQAFTLEDYQAIYTR